MHRAPTIRLSNTAIDVQGQRKIASYGLSRYNTPSSFYPCEINYLKVYKLSDFLRRYVLKS